MSPGCCRGACIPGPETGRPSSGCGVECAEGTGSETDHSFSSLVASCVTKKIQALQGVASWCEGQGVVHLPGVTEAWLVRGPQPAALRGWNIDMTQGGGPQAQICDPGTEIASTGAGSTLLRGSLSTRLQKPLQAAKGVTLCTVSGQPCRSGGSFGFIFGDRLPLCFGKSDEKTLSLCKGKPESSRGSSAGETQEPDCCVLEECQSCLCCWHICNREDMVTGAPVGPRGWG